MASVHDHGKRATRISLLLWRGLFLALGAAHGAVAGLPTNGMVLHYSFDTDGGAMVQDESGLGHDGAVSNAAWSSFGISRGAFRFHGSNDYIHAGAMTNWAHLTNGFSLAFWTRQVQPEVRGAYFLGTTGGGGAATNRFEFGCNQNSQGEILFRIYDNGGHEVRRRYGATGVDDGAWHHVALLVGASPSPPQVWLLVDGVELSPGESSGTTLQLTSRLNFPLVLGTAGDGGGGISATNSLNGYLDDVRIYDRVLATNEVLTLRNMMEGEPDDTRWEARVIWPGENKPHTMKSLDDEDWVFFYTFKYFTNYVFSAKQLGTNVDLRLDIYRAQEDGSLAHEDTVNDFGLGASIVETWTLANDTNALYYVRISTPTGLYGAAPAGSKAPRAAAGAGFGADTEYQSELYASPASPTINDIWVAAVDHAGGAAGIWASVDGVTNYFGATNVLLFANLASGSHSVRVGPKPGVRPREHPTEPGQVANPSSEQYGNPRTIVLSGSPRMTGFQYEPVNLQQAIVRDAHTGARMEDVAVLCISTSAPFVGTEQRRGHAWETAYQQPWRTGYDGTLPTNLLLLPTRWNIRFQKAGYVEATFTNVAQAWAWGWTNYMGEFLLHPVDLNGNGIADEWEARYYPAGHVVDPQGDTDGDRTTNWEEYMAGTDPTAWWDPFRAYMDQGFQGFQVRWIGRPWRTYRVERRAGPGDGDWTPQGETIIHWGTSIWWQIWADYEPGEHRRRAYRVRVVPP